jgi:hypothetical protein
VGGREADIVMPDRQNGAARGARLLVMSEMLNMLKELTTRYRTTY